MEWMHQLELIFLQWLQQFRLPALDQFFRFLNFFDTDTFYVMLIPLIWAGYYWKWGARFLFLLGLNGVLNTLAKIFFAQPRPYELMPSLGVIQLKTYGFPSGAAQSALLIAGIIIYTNRHKKWAWIAGLNYFFWISFSRIYLGVHFPTDLLGGWVLGALLLLGYIYFLPQLEKWIGSCSLKYLVGISQFVPLLLILIFPLDMTVMIGGAFMGVSLGLILSKRFHLFLPKSQCFYEGLLRFSLAIMVLGFVYYGMLFLKDLSPLGKFPVIFLSSYAMGVWISFGFSYIWRCCPFFKMDRK